VATTASPGRNSTRFEPAFTLTIGHEVDLDCVPGYLCRGDIDVNAATWFELEFGNRHGADFEVVRMDEVFDPHSKGARMKPPADLAGWVTGHPGVRVVDSPTSVTVGGRVATQLDVQVEADMPLGPSGMTGADDPGWFGLSDGHETRVILLRVDGDPIWISEQTGHENTVGDFDAVVTSLQQGPGQRVARRTAGRSPARAGPDLLGHGDRYLYQADLARDAVDARVWSGIHFRTADQVSITIGTQVANFALDHYLAAAD
jgi:hypothetical protein